jgi:hypothetical protein
MKIYLLATLLCLSGFSFAQIKEKLKSIKFLLSGINLMFRVGHWGYKRWKTGVCQWLRPR